MRRFVWAVCVTERACVRGWAPRAVLRGVSAVIALWTCVTQRAMCGALLQASRVPVGIGCVVAGMMSAAVGQRRPRGQWSTQLPLPQPPLPQPPFASRSVSCCADRCVHVWSIGPFACLAGSQPPHTAVTSPSPSEQSQSAAAPAGGTAVISLSVSQAASVCGAAPLSGFPPQPFARAFAGASSVPVVTGGSDSASSQVSVRRLTAGGCCALVLVKSAWSECWRVCVDGG